MILRTEWISHGQYRVHATTPDPDGNPYPVVLNINITEEKST